MSPVDERFLKRLAKVFHHSQEGTAAALLRGQSEGTVRRDLECAPHCQLSDRNVRGLRHVGQKRPRRERMESGDQKYRRVARVSSRASSIP